MRQPQSLVDRANINQITQQIHDGAVDEQGKPETFVAGWAVEVKPKRCGSVRCDRPHRGMIVIALRDSGHITLTLADDDYDKEVMLRINRDELHQLLLDLTDTYIMMLKGDPDAGRHPVPPLRPDPQRGQK